MSALHVYEAGAAPSAAESSPVAGTLRSRRLSDRDLAALAWIGEGYEIAQYHLTAVFGQHSPTIVSRFVCRGVERGLVVSERLLRIGMNRLRLSQQGAEYLAARGYCVEHVFVPRRATATKDLAHTFRINDLRTVFRTRQRPPAVLLPAWALQRMAWDDVIPDLLAVWKTTSGEPTFTLACEIDLATERLTTVFLPKLIRLARALHGRAGHLAAMLVLTEGERRANLIREFAGRELPLAAVVETLPSAFGPEGLRALRNRLEV